jgi:hypothetical protein
LPSMCVPSRGHACLCTVACDELSDPISYDFVHTANAQTKLWQMLWKIKQLEPGLKLNSAH